MLSVLIASGLANGLIYALIALGIVVLAKATDAVNFAHGDLVTFGGFVSYAVIVGAGLGGGAALLAVAVVAVVVGAAIFMLLRRLFQPQHAASLLIATIGVSFVLRGAMRLIWGGQGDYLSTPPLSTMPPIVVGEGAVIIPMQQLIMVAGASIILVLFWLFFRFTQMGLFMRAVADNPRAARIIGIPGPLVLGIAFVLSVVIATVSGFLLGPSTLLYPNLGFPLFVKGFAAAVLGGIYSLPGAIVGGVALGLLESMVAGYASSQIQDLSAFIVIFLTLLLLPGGLFGGARRRTV
jgi:branched-chain amino acid transport system permease protein